MKSCTAYLGLSTALLRNTPGSASLKARLLEGTPETLIYDAAFTRALGNQEMDDKSKITLLATMKEMLAKADPKEHDTLLIVAGGQTIIAGLCIYFLGTINEKIMGIEPLASNLK